MYELIRVSEHAYYMDCPSKVGILRTGEREVVAIDGGSDKDAGKKLLKALNANGWSLKAIYVTHSHADHIGGNAYLHKQTGCRIFASDTEMAFTRHPILESALLYGGFPLPAMKNKFLMAQESPAELLRAEEMPEGMEWIPLPGHSFDMVGYRTAEDVVFLADCVSSKETLEKYIMTFLVDVEASLRTLDAVEKMQAACFVPAHAPATEDIAPLAQINRSAILTVAEKIESLCAQPIGFEEMLRALFRAYGMSMNLTQYSLIGSTLRSYLTWLCAQGRMECFFEDDRMLWRRVPA